MQYSLAELARKIGAELRGDPDLKICGLATIEKAKSEELSYVASPKFRKIAESSQASALIAYPSFDDKEHSLLILKDPHLGFARAMRLFYRLYPTVEPGIARGACIADGVTIPSSAHIGHNAVISTGVRIGEKSVISAGAFIGENSLVGENCYIFPNVTIRENIKIGNNVVIYPNVVIGSDGFSYCWDGQQHIKIPQAGTVIIEDDVEIGAGTTIDRATLGETFIGRGAIIDNLVQIGHNCRIGEYSVICAQVGLAGTTTLDRHVTLAGQVGVAGHLTIGDEAIIEAQSGVAGDVPVKAVYFGTPAREFKQAHKINAIIGRLPEYISRLRKLEGLLKKDEPNP
jgi:UDP-3-O-[3-hydroxymyristoyl] glucosamine N-acyltransferase